MAPAGYEEKYKELELVGEGGYGSVWKVETNDDVKRFFAAKKVKMSNRDSKKLAMKELDILKVLDCQHIIKLEDYFDEPKDFIIVTEYLDGGELFEKCVEDDILESDGAYFVNQVCRGLNYLHSKAIVHLDIKPENIVITKPGGRDIKIVDFGSALKLTPGSSVRAMVGTAEFVSPEVVSYEDIHTNTDMWSLGVLTFILLSGASPFLDYDEQDQKTLQNVSMAKYDFDYEEFDDVSSEAKDFITRLLRRDPLRRISASECLSHPWLGETNQKKNSGKIKIENLRNYLAKRKLKSIGKVLKAVNVFIETSRDSKSRSASEDKSDEES